VFNFSFQPRMSYFKPVK